MTRIYLRAAGVLAAAGIGVAIVAAAPAPAAQTISFTEQGISDHSFNLGSGHGFAVGYVELVATKLMQGSTQIGHDGKATQSPGWAAAPPTRWSPSARCSPTARSTWPAWSPPHPKGPGTFQLAVTGGTGSYQDARGYATVVPGPGTESHHPPHIMTATGPGRAWPTAWARRGRSHTGGNNLSEERSVPAGEFLLGCWSVQVGAASRTHSSRGLGQFA